MLVNIAKVGRAHGLRGAVNLQIQTDDPAARFAAGAKVEVAGTNRTLTVSSVNSQSGKFLVQFQEVTDRNGAEALLGAQLQAPALPAQPEDDAWYEHELAGLEVVTTSGQVVGSVIGLEYLPAQDLIVFKETNGTITRIPLVHQLVPEVDIPAGRVVIDPPGGLLSTDSANAVVIPPAPAEQNQTQELE